MSRTQVTESEPDWLELRVHGVNNTSPPDMLDLADEKVELVAGDALGGFWAAKAGVLDSIHETERGWTPAGVRREAYSWGGLARTSPDGWGPGVLHTVLAAFGRIAWVLLIPFGLANVAYWSRRLPGPDQRDGTARRGLGAMSARLFGLGLTLLFLVTICDVAFDLVARQCYQHNRKLCDSLPSQLDVVTGWGLNDRLAAASLLPVLVLAGLWWVTNSSRARYEQFVTEQQVAPPRGGPQVRPDAVRPVLTQPDFWTGDRMIRGLLSLHLAASLGVITLMTSVPAVLGTSTGCQTFRQIVLSRTCIDDVRDQPKKLLAFGIISVLALMLVAGAVWRLCVRVTDAPDVHAVPATGAGAAAGPAGPGAGRPAGRLLLMAASVLLAAELGFLHWGNPTLQERSGLPGMAALPTLVAALLLGLVAASLAWRRSGDPGLWVRGLALLAGALVAAGLLGPVAPAPWSWLVPSGGGAALVVMFVVTLRRSPEQTAWRGCAPAVFQSLAVMSALTLSSLVVLTTGDWLNGGHSAASLIEGGSTKLHQDPVLHVPGVFVWFGMLALTGVVLTLLALLVVALIGARHEPPAPAMDESIPGLRAGEVMTDAAYGMNAARARARRFAAVAQRAELWVAFLSVIGTIAVAVAVVASASMRELSDGQANDSWFAQLVGGATQAVVVVGLAGVGLLAGGKAVGGVRPLGLVWDLICFLPRAAHPLGPPCYAERAVPELTDRVVKWLAPGPDRTPDPRRRVVLSAHSLGSVLAVGVLFHLRESADRISLLTYGSQLRAYFGRLFPELLGPDVMGTPPCRAPRLVGPDPWRDQLRGQPAAPAREAEPVTGTLVSRLTADGADSSGVRWRNLWRRTDYLGFPVASYVAGGEGAIDQPAQELDATGYMLTVMSHSDYPRAPAYSTTLEAMSRLAPSRRRGWRLRRRGSRAPT